MVEFTVGVASACIAAGIAAMQFILPNALALVLTGRLSEEESYSAVTWSVMSRFILSSHWPLILRSDANASKSVVRSVSLITWIRPIGFLLIAVAAVVTPLGLYEVFAASSETTNIQFVYVRKDDVFGQSTTPRHVALGPSRLCGDRQLCPSMPDLGNATLSSFGYNRSVPIKTPPLLQASIDLFQSGRGDLGPTVAGPFDIQFRQFGVKSRADIVNNGTYVVSRFERLASLLLEKDYTLVEGLIVDPTLGSIGFRNHSVPPGVRYAAEWEEDILFMEPDAACVNLNVTVAYEIPLNKVGDQFKSLYETWSLIDRGGFIKLPRTPPFPDANESYPFGDGQKNPQLYQRAYNVAWAVNYYAMLALNLTSQNFSTSPVLSSLDQKINIVSPYKVWDLPDGATFITNGDVVRTLAGDYIDTWSSLGNMISVSRGPTLGGFSELDNIAADIAAVVLPAHQSKDLPKGVGEGNTTFERPVYACATATKLAIKTVKFCYNSTDGGNGLGGLRVIGIEPRKRATSDNTLTWGLETPVPAMPLVWGEIGWKFDPLWGFFDHAATQQANVSSYSGETFYLPASGTWNFDGMESEIDNIAATVGPPAIWVQTLSEFSTTHDLYSGKGDQALINFWRSRSDNETGVASALKSIWTDIAANALVGTRGLHTVDGDASMKTKRQSVTERTLAAGYPVHLYSRQLRYNWAYGIPMMMCLLLVGSAAIIALISVIFGKGAIKKLRLYMYQVTAGRILASWAFPETRPVSTAPTKEWIEHVGSKRIDVFAHSTSVDTAQTQASSKKQYVQVRQREEDDPSQSISQVWSR